MDVAERLRSNLERRAFEGIEESVTASFGVATSCSTDRGSLDDLIGEADRAMYRAKKEGRNRVVLSD